jgi:hypothetical protein
LDAARANGPAPDTEGKIFAIGGDGPKRATGHLFNPLPKRRLLVLSLDLHREKIRPGPGPDPNLGVRKPTSELLNLVGIRRRRLRIVHQKRSPEVLQDGIRIFLTHAGLHTNRNHLSSEMSGILDSAIRPASSR